MSHLVEALANLQKQAKQSGVPIYKLYLNSRKEVGIKLAKKLPLLFSGVFAKRYILPKFRELHYFNQEACDWLMLDMILGMASNEIDFADEVLNTEYVAMIRQMEFGRPTFFLERELGLPMMKTRLPDDFYVSDIHWKFPAFRVYLPKDLLCIERNGKKSALMFLDITKIDKDTIYEFSQPIKNEFKQNLRSFKNNYDGFGVSGNLDFDGEESAIGYAGSSPLDGVTLKEITQIIGDLDMNRNWPSDQIDKVFVKRMNALAINILLFLSSYPLEYEPKKDLIRLPKQEGKRILSGLYKAKFIGESQIRPYKPSEPRKTPIAPTGAEIAAHWVSGHWKRIWFGPGKKENRLQWIGLYHTGKNEDQNSL